MTAARTMRFTIDLPRDVTYTVQQPLPDNLSEGSLDYDPAPRGRMRVTLSADEHALIGRRALIAAAIDTLLAATPGELVFAADVLDLRQTGVQVTR